ncbi:MAG: hypothetical protein ACJA13_003324 [Paraglaciecola sp.]|jgi:hypothetical protein
MPLPNLFMALEERVQVFNKFVGIPQTLTPFIHDHQRQAVIR